MLICIRIENPSLHEEKKVRKKSTTTTTTKSTNKSLIRRQIAANLRKKKKYTCVQWRWSDRNYISKLVTLFFTRVQAMPMSCQNQVSKRKRNGWIFILNLLWRTQSKRSASHSTNQSNATHCNGKIQIHNKYTLKNATMDGFFINHYSAVTLPTKRFKRIRTRCCQ